MADPTPRPPALLCSGAADSTGCACGLQATLQGMALDDSMAASLWDAIEAHGEGGVGSGRRRRCRRRAAYLLPLLLMLRRLQLPSQIQQLSLQETAEDQWAAARTQRTLS